MATIVREFILNADDTLDLGALYRLNNNVKGKTCGNVMKKNKKVCGRPYIVSGFGRCGCFYHEDYDHAIQAIKFLNEADEYLRKTFPDIRWD